MISNAQLYIHNIDDAPHITQSLPDVTVSPLSNITEAIHGFNGALTDYANDIAAQRKQEQNFAMKSALYNYYADEVEKFNKDGSQAHMDPLAFYQGGLSLVRQHGATSNGMDFLTYLSTQLPNVKGDQQSVGSIPWALP